MLGDIIPVKTVVPRILEDNGVRCCFFNKIEEPVIPDAVIMRIIKIDTPAVLILITVVVIDRIGMRADKIHPRPGIAVKLIVIHVITAAVLNVDPLLIILIAPVVINITPSHCLYQYSVKCITVNIIIAK